MQQYIMLLILTGLLAAGLSGCGNSGPDNSPAHAARPDTSVPAAVPGDASSMPQKAVGTGEQPQRRFILQTADGLDVSGKDRPVTLELRQNSTGTGILVSGSVCNRFTGQGNLENGLLTVKNMVSTKMFCADKERNALESVFTRMLEQGAGFSLEGGTLVLRREEHELVYRLH